MKLTITKTQLTQGLQAVQSIVGAKTTLPVLSNVLLSAAAGRLSLTGTDLDVTISTSVEAQVDEAGAITLPARKLSGIVKELPTQQIQIEVDDRGHCRITAGSSFYKMNGLGAQEFPAPPKIDGKRTVTLPQAKLKSLLRQTSFAISTDESRFVLNGIFFQLTDLLRLVATDGRRLALAETELDVAKESKGEAIVPSKAINELSRLIGNEGDVTIRFSDNQAVFEMGQTTLISKLVDGNYPNYKQVIPGEARERLTLVREELLQALRRAELMTSEKSCSVKLSFTRNSLEITANTPEVGEAREVLAVNYKGADVSIAFNPTYVMDPLKNLDDDEVYLELIDELSPGVLKTGGQFLYVIMPMRTT